MKCESDQRGSAGGGGADSRCLMSFVRDRRFSKGRSETAPRQPLHRASAASSQSTIVGIFLLLLTLSSPLRAHDIYTSWTDATLHDDRLELTLTLARASAARLLPNADLLPPITPDNFARVATQLKATAAELFELSSDGKLLKLTRADVTISGDSDITFQLTYPRPGIGQLRFVAKYLLRLVDGHVGTLVVSDAAGNDLGCCPVVKKKPVFEIRVPPPPPVAPKK